MWNGNSFILQENFLQANSNHFSENPVVLGPTLTPDHIVEYIPQLASVVSHEVLVPIYTLQHPPYAYQQLHPPVATTPVLVPNVNAHFNPNTTITYGISSDNSNLIYYTTPQISNQSNFSYTSLPGIQSNRSLNLETPHINQTNINVQNSQVLFNVIPVIQQQQPVVITNHRNLLDQLDFSTHQPPPLVRSDLPMDLKVAASHQLLDNFADLYGQSFTEDTVSSPVSPSSSSSSDSSSSYTPSTSSRQNPRKTPKNAIPETQDPVPDSRQNFGFGRQTGKSETLKMQGITNRQRNLIFGYGSLISPTSRLKTCPDLESNDALPVRVSGIHRTWSLQGGGAAYLSAVACSPELQPTPTPFSVKRTVYYPDDDLESDGRTETTAEQKSETVSSELHPEDHVCNGVLFAVTEKQLYAFDRREFNYLRIGIPHRLITPLREDSKFALSENDLVWAYLLPSHRCRLADEFHPLIQTYVDVVLYGCLTISKEFANEFIISSWSDTPITSSQMSKLLAEIEATNQVNDSIRFHTLPWINDRNSPMYSRTERRPKEVNEYLDSLLNFILRESFKRIEA
ncbi:hypothetical protein HK098_003699 [Nowakowskiella sp. JEL0407]|nr:hypothetical protein HK098_003699 [Nowakowskiella sp. JEL0407]